VTLLALISIQPTCAPLQSYTPAAVILHLPVPDGGEIAPAGVATPPTPTVCPLGGGGGGVVVELDGGAVVELVGVAVTVVVLVAVAVSVTVAVGGAVTVVVVVVGEAVTVVV